jgi:hypothetical protein
MAEEEGRRCGCSRIALTTLSIEAPGFYLKQGYNAAATIDLSLRRQVASCRASDLAEINAVRGGAAALLFKVPRSSVTIQVLSAGLAEFNKEIEPALFHIVQHLVHGAVRPKVGLNDRVECPLRSRDDCSGRHEPYPSEQSKKLGRVRDVVLLVTERSP